HQAGARVRSRDPRRRAERERLAVDRRPRLRALDGPPRARGEGGGAARARGPAQGISREMTLEAVRAQLSAVVAAVETLGPILELDREWRTPGGNVEQARAIRTRIQEVLDGPPCPYDESALGLYRALIGLTARGEA